MRKLLAGSDGGPDEAQKRPPRVRGRSYAEIIQQLRGRVDNLHEALSQLQLENRDLKLRQEVLEQWCRINRLALQAMRTHGAALMHGRQQDLSQAAIAAIVSAEEWIQQQLVDPGPRPAEQAAPLCPPKGGTGSSDSCTLQGHALSLLEYAVRNLLANPQQYSHVSSLVDPESALAWMALQRERAKSLLAAVEGHLSPGQIDTGDGERGPGVTSTGGSVTGVSGQAPCDPPPAAAAPCTAAAPMPADGAPQGDNVCTQDAQSATPNSGATSDPGGSADTGDGAQPPAAGAVSTKEAALQELAVWITHIFSVMICGQLLDPAIGYGCMHRAAELAGPPTPAKVASVVAKLRLAPEQRAAIAARVRVVSELLAPANAAWDEVLTQMRQVLLEMQQQQQALPPQQQEQEHGQQQDVQQLLQVQVESFIAVPLLCGSTAAAYGAGPGAAQADAVVVGAAPPATTSDHTQQAAASPEQCLAVSGDSTAHSTAAPTVATAAAAVADPHSRLTHLVRRLTTLSRTLGWLEVTGACAGLGVLTWQQLGVLFVVTDPYPLLPRPVMACIAAQWEAEHGGGAAATTTSSKGDSEGEGAGWPQRLRHRSSPSEQNSKVRGKDSPQQQEQQQEQQQHVAAVPGTSCVAACSSHPPKQQQQQQHVQQVGVGMHRQLDGVGPTPNRQPMAPEGGCSSWPRYNYAPGAGTANNSGMAHLAVPAAILAALQDQQDVYTSGHHQQQHSYCYLQGQPQQQQQQLERPWEHQQQQQHWEQHPQQLLGQQRLQWQQQLHLPQQQEHWPHQVQQRQQQQQWDHRHHQQLQQQEQQPHQLQQGWEQHRQWEQQPQLQEQQRQQWEQQPPQQQLRPPHQQQRPTPSGLLDLAPMYASFGASSVHRGRMNVMEAGDGAMSSVVPVRPAYPMPTPQTSPMPVPLAHPNVQSPIGVHRGDLLPTLLELCDVVLEGDAQGGPGEEKVAGAALDALLDLLLE